MNNFTLLAFNLLFVPFFIASQFWQLNGLRKLSVKNLPLREEPLALWGADDFLFHNLESLELVNLHLQGEFPPALLFASHLQHLNLSHNEFGGAVSFDAKRHSARGRADAAQYMPGVALLTLDLSNNRFVGAWPDASLMHRLTSISLANNYFYGTMTKDVALKYVSLSHSKGASGCNLGGGLNCFHCPLPVSALAKGCNVHCVTASACEVEGPAYSELRAWKAGKVEPVLPRDASPGASLAWAKAHPEAAASLVAQGGNLYASDAQAPPEEAQLFGASIAALKHVEDVSRTEAAEDAEASGAQEGVADVDDEEDDGSDDVSFFDDDIFPWLDIVMPLLLVFCCIGCVVAVAKRKRHAQALFLNV